MDPADEPPRPEAPASRTRRARERAAQLQALAQRLAERAEAERERHRAVDVVFVAVDRDSEVGGGIMAGALAYRLFIFMLPLALVAVGGLGIVSSASSDSPEQAAKSVGLAGLVSSSVASAAAEGTARWYALLIGIPILVYATRSLLRGLIVVHRLVWTDVRGTAPRPTLRSTLLLLLVLVGSFALSAFGNVLRQKLSLSGDVIAVIVGTVAYAGLWLFVAVRMPHRGVHWTALLPGSVLFGVGIQVIRVVTTYFIAPQASSRQSTYGALGLAAALLLGLYLIARLVVAAAVLNVTLWEHHEWVAERAHTAVEPPSEIAVALQPAEGDEPPGRRQVERAEAVEQDRRERG